MSLSKNSDNDKFAFGKLRLENSNEEVILGITIKNKLTIDSHIKIYVKSWLRTLCTIKNV